MLFPIRDYIITFKVVYFTYFGKSKTTIGDDTSDAFENVYAYLEVDYDRRAYNASGTRWQYLLKNVSGNWDIQQSGIQLKNKKVMYACTASFETNQVVYKYPQANSFNYSTGFTTYVPDDPVLCSVQAKTTTDITRGSETWQLELEVSIVNNNEF